MSIAPTQAQAPVIPDPILDFIPLASCFYTSDYIGLRRSKILCFSKILYQNKEFKNWPYKKQSLLLQQLELSCWNMVFDLTKNTSSRENDKIDFHQNYHDFHQNYHDIHQNYHDICFNVATNLDKNSVVDSSYLINRLISGEINPINVGKLSSQELCPEKYIEICNKLNKRSSVKETRKTTELYKCSKCKKNQCSLETIWCRAADEMQPMRATCLFCNNSFNV